MPENNEVVFDINQLTWPLTFRVDQPCVLCKFVQHYHKPTDHLKTAEKHDVEFQLCMPRYMTRLSSKLSEYLPENKPKPFSYATSLKNASSFAIINMSDKS